MLLDQPQNGAQALGHVETVVLAALLPGKDGQELQGIGWGQRGTAWLFLILSCNLSRKANPASVQDLWHA